jgi:putative intracellular protease/amidase
MSLNLGNIGKAQKGKIGVLIEEHFDCTEFRAFNDFFPAQGYQVEYLSHLWGNAELTFGSNPENGNVEEYVEVSTEINSIEPHVYRGIILIGGYAMDRLRYQANPVKGATNMAPALVFLRKAAADKQVKIGTICHSLWLFCADPALLEGRQATCAHNIICDLVNAGADVVFDGHKTADVVVDGNLISASHPAVVERFMQIFVSEIECMDSEKLNTAVGI